MDTIFSFLKWLLINTLAREEVRNAAVVVGVVVAIYSIFTARAIARKKQSADMLFNSRGDTQLQAGYLSLVEYHNGERNIRQLANAEAAQTEESKNIRYLLNHMESLAVGIQAGIYDETMLKSAWFSIITDTYERAAPYIQAARERDKKTTIYQDFEWLAKKWKKKPLKARTQ